MRERTRIRTMATAAELAILPGRGLKLIALILLFAALLFPALSATGAETVYVSDQLVISLRQEKANDAPSVMGLKTGTSLEVLADEGDFLKVRTADGTEGFVLRRFTSSQRPAPVMVRELQEKLAKLEAERAASPPQTGTEFEERLEKARQQFEEVNRNLETKEKERLAAVAAYEALQAENAQTVKTVAERDRLQQENTRLNAELKQLRQTTGQTPAASSSFFSKELKSFMAGGAVFFIGWLLGRARRKQRNRY